MPLLRALLIIMVLSLCVVSEPRQPVSDAPYIYYFSERLNSYVIERADGTETRLLGQGVTKAPTTERYAYYISGPGWSPSGRWLAWQRKDFNEGGVTLAAHNYAVRIGDNRRLTALDKFPDAEMVWSPTQDLLFVVSSNYESKMGNLPLHQPGMVWLSFGLIDAEKDEVIYSETQGVRFDGGYSLAYPDPFSRAIQWVDAQHVVVGYRWFPLTNENEDYTVFFRTFDFQNRTSKTIAVDEAYQLVGAAANDRLTSGRRAVHQKRSAFHPQFSR